MTYIFNANIQISENKTPNYICVIADIANKYTDTNPSNNTYCTNNNNSVLYPIYPNPTSDFINISFNLDHNSMIRIELFDNLGKQISLIDNKEYQKGFHKLTYNVSKLNEAVYSVKLSIDNKSEIIKFIKN
jgi:dipeptidyl aminopeptidase/acylaminoacyl peptidase